MRPFARQRFLRFDTKTTIYKKWTSSKFKMSVLVKHFKRMNRPATGWEEIFANLVSDNGLVSSIRDS